jgi:hypothetical protein
MAEEIKEQDEKTKEQIADLLGPTEEVTPEEVDTTEQDEKDPIVEDSKDIIEDKDKKVPTDIKEAEKVEVEPETDVEVDDGAIELPEKLPTDPAELTKLVQSIYSKAQGMRETINELSRTSISTPIEKVVTPDAAASKQVAQPVLSQDEAIKVLKDLVENSKELLTKEELDKVVDDPSLINTAIQRSIERMSDGFIKALPAFTTNIVKQHTALQSIVTDFYTENKDLEPYRDYVMKVSQDIGKLEPNLTVAEMLSKTAAEARKRLKLPVGKSKIDANNTPKPPVKRDTKPAFATQRKVSTTRISPASRLSDQKSQIKDLLS